MGLSFEGYGITTPETRAEIMAAMVKYVAGLTQPATFSAMYFHILREFGVKEDEIGGDIHRAYSTLVFAGLFSSNDYDPEAKSVTVSARTTVWPSKSMTDYIWTGPEDRRADIECED